MCLLSPEVFGLCCSVDCLTLCILRNQPEESVTLHHHQQISELPNTHRSLSSGGDQLILSPLHGLLDFQLFKIQLCDMAHCTTHSWCICHILNAIIMQWSQKILQDIHTLLLWWFCTMDLIWNSDYEIKITTPSFNSWEFPSTSDDQFRKCCLFIMHSLQILWGQKAIQQVRINSHHN